jgi:predicted RNase H-like nuclease (RuvC/YqgF family)
MQLPGLDELEASVAKAVEEIGNLRTENSALRARLRALGKEIDDLASQLAGLGSGQKVDSRKKKRIEAKLKGIVDKLA